MAEGEAAVVVAVVGRMAAVGVAVEALAAQSLAGTADSHWLQWQQTPTLSKLISTKDANTGERRGC